MTRMKSLTDHLAAIHARIKENAEKKLAAQPELDLGMDDQAAPEQAQPIPASDVDAPTAKPPKVRRERSKLLPSHHTDRDFFLCDLFDYAMKDDGVSMEAPIFTLATKPDLSVWHWESKGSPRFQCNK